MSPDSQPSIVIIDDDEELLTKFRLALEREFSQDGVEIRTWKPEEGQNPIQEFGHLIDDETTLVVTDYDLTKNGMTGLFGVSIVSWCQARSIPVGDFSRANLTSLPKEPALFELRVPADVDDGASYSVRMFRGFRRLRDLLASGAIDLQSVKSPAQVLAAVLDRPHLEGQFALYMSLLGAANSSLLDNLRSVLSPKETISSAEKKEQLLVYVLGHVLANAVLRYPGPILSERALCAYVATTGEEAPAVGEIFHEAVYGGPFSSGATYYWRSDVDRIIHREAAVVEDASSESSGGFNRAVVEKVLSRALALHECSRCGGRNGGYLCPFTDRTVCERADCSVAANSWIPAGADVSRIERDFYEEWAPLLGL